MDRPTICTIVAKNYLAQARCLTESFLKHHPDGQVFVLLADRRDGFFDPSQEQFITLEAHDLQIPDFDQMAFRYTVVEFNTAVKPFLLEYLFSKYQLRSLCYFDPDIYFYRPITPIFDLLEHNSVVLTPHLLAPIEDSHLPDEPYILRAGVYNLGFIGLAQGPDLERLLRWWQRRLLKDCVVDIARGLFVDQRWIDLIPGFFDRVAILREPGFNVAYWNLNHRTVHQRDGELLVNGKPLFFYHFSGLPLNEISAISKHQDRYSLADLPDLKPLFVDYRDRMLANGHDLVKRWPYAYGRFDNGVNIPDMARHLWRNLNGETRWPRPFAADSADSFFHWLNREAHSGVKQGALISNLAIEVYRQRWDLQQAFPDVLETHREAYARWFAESAQSQHQFDDLFVDQVRASLSAVDARPPAAEPAAAEVPVSVERGQPPAQSRLLYRAVRAPLRRLGLNGPIKRLLGPRLVDALYASVARQRSRPVIIEAPLRGRPTLQRRLYYAVRNPLRRAGLHTVLKRMIGKQRVHTLYERMVEQSALPPEARTRNAASLPYHMVFVPREAHQQNGVKSEGASAEQALRRIRPAVSEGGTALQAEHTLQAQVGGWLATYPADAAVVAIPLGAWLHNPCALIEQALATLEPATPLLLIGERLGPSSLDTLIEQHGALYVALPDGAEAIDTLNCVCAWCAPRDIVLLGADVELPPGWLPRLRAAAYVRSTVVSATPLSNDEWFRGIQAGAQSGGLSFAEIDARVQAHARRLRPIIPAPSASCVYLKRSALDLIGGFDRLYSALDDGLADFAQQAVAISFSHVLADDLFVGRRIAAPADSRAEASAERDLARQVLAQRYHWYADWLAQSSDRNSHLAQALEQVRQAVVGAKIAIDATCIDGTPNGTHVGTLGLIRAIAATLQRPNQLTLILKDGVPLGALDGVDRLVDQVLRVSDVEAFKQPQFDLIHRPFQVAEIGHLHFLQQAARRLVVSQLDCIAFANPSYAPDIASWHHLRKTNQLLFDIADGIAFNSHDVLADAQHQGLDIAPDRGLIAYNGVEQYYDTRVAAQPPAQAEALADQPFILVIGANYRHKNRVYALRLLHELIVQYQWPGRVVFVGSAIRFGGSEDDELAELRRKPELSARVCDFKAISEAEKRWLLERAALVLYPSIYEGFGFVPFEAAAVNVPALTSRATALAEVLGDAPLFLERMDPAEGARVAWCLLTDPEAARQQVAAINTRAGQFTWSAVAERVWRFYQHILSQPPRAQGVIDLLEWSDELAHR